jgi:hypothetical protein
MFQQAQQSRFDWARAIQFNCDALIAVVAAIFRMLRIDGDDAPERMAPHLHRRALRLLTPAESACRRLIVIAARGLVAKPLPVAQPKAQGASAKSANAGHAPRRPRPPRFVFKLYDPRKSFRERKPPKGSVRRVMPRICVLGAEPLVVTPWSAYQLAPVPVPPPDDGLINARPLCRRLHALQAALGDVPHQAQRLVRWQARREQQQASRPVFATPLRPGEPPGYRRKPVREVDDILNECNSLAFHAMRLDWEAKSGQTAPPSSLPRQTRPP